MQFQLLEKQRNERGKNDGKGLPKLKKKNQNTTTPPVTSIKNTHNNCAQKRLCSFKQLHFL